MTNDLIKLLKEFPDKLPKLIRHYMIRDYYCSLSVLNWKFSHKI